MRGSIKIGYIVLALAQITLSVNVVVTKYLLDFMPMFWLLSCRFFMSSVLLFSVLKATSTPFTEALHPDGKLSKADWLYAVLQGIFAAFLFNLFFVWGLESTTATAAGIISSALPAITALSAVWLLKEKLNSPKIMGLILAILGILIINVDHIDAADSTTHTYFGDLLVLVAMFPEAWYSIVSRKVAGRMTPLAAAFIANLVGFVTLLPCALYSGPFDFEFCSSFEFGMLFLGALSSLIFFWAWGWGLTFITASTAAIFGGLLPVAISVLAIFFLGESLHWYDIVGIMFVISSIIVATGYKPSLTSPTKV